MWGALRIGLFGAIASLFGAAGATAEPVPLTGEAIQSTVAGAIVELDTPLGTKIPVRFSRDGLMAGEAGTLAGFLGAARDRGRWWVESNRLCMKWFRWFEAEARCMDLRQHGDRVFWQEQSGRSGTATIAGKLDEKPVMPAYAAASAVQGLAKQKVARRQAEGRAAPTVAEPRRAEPRESREAKETHAPAPVAVPAPSPAPSAARQIVTAAKAPPAPARAEQSRAHPRSDDASKAAPPLPVRSATRPSAPPASNVRVPSFSVVRVAYDDVLNVRVGPSEYHRRIGALPPDGRGIRIIGVCRGLWCPVRHGRLSGWVNSYYLAAELPSASAVAEAR